MASPVSAPASLAPSRSRAILLLAAIFTFFFAAYAFTLSGDFFSTGDTTIRIEMADDFIFKNTLFLQGWDLQLPHYYKKESLDPRVSTGRDGKTYSTYLLGQPLALVPLHLISTTLGQHERWPVGAAQLMIDRLVGPLFGALEAMTFFMFAVALGYSLRRSILLTAIFGFATMAWPDEQSVLEHTEVAFFCLLAFYFAFRFRDRHLGPRLLVLSGLALGGAMITRYQDALLAGLGIGAYLLLPGDVPWRLTDRIRRLVLFGIGVLPSIALDLWFNWARFGSVTATGHHETLFGYPITLGVPGLLVSPGKGLLWYCPTILLLVFAGIPFARRYGALSVGFIVACAGFILLYAHVTYWHGDPAWGPRYIYPLVPLLTLPLGELFRRRYRWRPGVLAITALVVLASLTIQVAAVSVSQWRTWYRVISYEENQGYSWAWMASRYDYFWNPHESPLLFQLHGLYQLAYDSVRHSSKYELVPPDEDPVLDGLTVDYAINQWNFWWTANEFNWWMGPDKVVLIMMMLLSVALASGTYIAAEAGGVFEPQVVAQLAETPVPEAA